MIHWLILLTVSFYAAAFEVAFLEYHNPDGTLVQLEPGGRFYHTAIRYQGHWLHAWPDEGVNLVSDRVIEDYGHRLVILSDDSREEPSTEAVHAWLGKPFDRSFGWTDPNSTYCTRLIANLLGVQPQPMSFASSCWKNRPGVAIGQLGLSPDELYETLKRVGFRELTNCERDLTEKVQ